MRVHLSHRVEHLQDRGCHRSKLVGTHVIDSENLCANGSHFLDFYVVASVKVRSTV